MPVVSRCLDLYKSLDLEGFYQEESCVRKERILIVKLRVEVLVFICCGSLAFKCFEFLSSLSEFVTSRVFSCCLALIVGSSHCFVSFYLGSC